MVDRSVSMQFGKAGGTVRNRPGMKYISGGEITNDTEVVLTFTAGAIYFLLLKVWNATSGAYRGHALYYIAAPERDLFGSVAIARATAATGGTISVTLTNKKDSSLTLKRGASTYAFRYALYRAI